MPAITLDLKERIARCLAKHPDWTNSRVANSASCKTLEVAAYREGSLGQETKPGVISLEQVFKTYDTRAAIISALAGITRGEFLSEDELRLKVTGQDRSRFRRTIENNAEEFNSMRVLLKIDKNSKEGRWFWGHPDDIKKASDIRDK